MAENTGQIVTEVIYSFDVIPSPC